MNGKYLFNNSDTAMEPEQGQPKQEALILNLPDEILAAILEQLYDPKPSCVLEYASTCKQFYRHMAPMMYRQIRAPGETVPLASLYKTLQENPSLAHECQWLRIALSSYVEDDYRVLEEMVPSFVNAASVIIHNNPDSIPGGRPMRLAQTCALDMPSLQDLCLFSDGWGNMVDVRQAMFALHSASLKKLTIVNGIMHDPRMWQHDEDGEPLEPDLDEDFATATISELVLIKWQPMGGSMDKLLLWTDQLTSFHLGHATTSYSMDLPMIVSMLMKHKNTLVELSIGYIGVGRSPLPDLTNFKALRVLSLNSNATGWNYDGEQGPAPLLAPNLKKFTWDFFCEMFPAQWGPFTQGEEQWVRDFATVAANRKSPDLEFAFSYYPPLPRKKSQGYPWDQLDGLNDELSHQGVAVTYNTAPLTKEQWEEWGQSFEGDEDPHYQREEESLFKQAEYYAELGLM